VLPAVPVNCATIEVPVVTPVPENVCPISSTGVVAVTVIVVPLMEAVNAPAVAPPYPPPPPPPAAVIDENTDAFPFVPCSVTVLLAAFPSAPPAPTVTVYATDGKTEKFVAVKNPPAPPPPPI
jgi:hypothetical protein